MPPSRKRKNFLGAKLRRFREQTGLTQASMASSLDISASYLNQMENDQRPLTVSVLLKLTQVFDLDLQTFSEEEDDRIVAEVQDCLEDPMFQASKVDFKDLKDWVARSPDIAKHFLTLYRAYDESKMNYAGLAQSVVGDEAVRAVDGPQFPYEEVRDYFYYHSNYFDELDRVASGLSERLELTTGNIEWRLIDYLRDQHQISVKLEGSDERLRTFDLKKRTLTLSRLLSSRQRVFQLAHQLCSVEARDVVDRMIKKARFNSVESESVARVGLANYFAGALLMPYALFLEKARQEGYDIERLQIIFNASFEQVCHRMSTLQRPSAKGVPFYFLRVDAAGNISKRQSASSFHFARVGGACPLWNVHEAFATPGKILRQIAQMPDGKMYFCIARTVSRTEGGYLMPQKNFAVGLGCEIHYASQLIYSVGMDLNDKEAAVPIGVSCRVCERENCSQRAFPPIGRRVIVNENERDFLPYQFDQSEDG